MEPLKLIKHVKGAPGLRFLGLGPNLKPSQGLIELKKLLDNYAFWAKERNIKDLRKCLGCSSVVISLWRGNRMVGFGRATTDEIYRAVLWDVVVAEDLQGQGLGSLVVKALLESPSINKAERIYLMTSNSSEFYEQFNFKISNTQKLLVKQY